MGQTSFHAVDARLCVFVWGVWAVGLWAVLGNQAPGLGLAACASTLRAWTGSPIEASGAPARPTPARSAIFCGHGGMVPGSRRPAMVAQSAPNSKKLPFFLVMSMAWLREAAAASAQRSAIPAVPPSTAAAATWSRIDDLGGGLFLCGAAALENRAELERLGIRSILNCATEDLYDRSYSGSSAPLRQKLEALQGTLGAPEPLSFAFR